MQSRIPLSIVLSAEGTRHAIPHRTFRIPVSQTTDAPQTEQQKEGVSFFYYLDSNDTRLPSHPHLRAYAQLPEDYETYVGEEVWEKKGAAEPPASSAHEAEAEALAPVPEFRGVVDWVNRVFDEEDWAEDGVVLCGRYVVADDGAWVVPSRSPTLYTTREVFLLMRNSCKFLRDVHAQMKVVAAASSGLPCHHGFPSPLYLEFTLAKALAGSGASEMRALIPYPLHFSATTQGWVTDCAAASLSFTGIGQRLTDACFPSLMAWSEDEHDQNFRLMLRRMEQAALLERTLEANSDFISRLVAKFHKRNCVVPSQSAAGSNDDPGARQSEEHLTLLLNVDLLFEGPSLPIYILSAKARVFEVAQRTDAEWDGLQGRTTSRPLWTPLLKLTEDEEDEDHNATAGAPPVTADKASSHSSNSDAAEEREGDSEEDDDEEVGGGGAGTLSFFRMFRDAAHWNQYVAAMVQRLHDAATDGSICPDSNKPSRNVQHYCVIASEGADLVTCGDTLTKRGLPLELMHPELLEQNEEAATFLKMLRDGLFKKPSGEN